VPGLHTSGEDLRDAKWAVLETERPHQLVGVNETLVKSGELDQPPKTGLGHPYPLMAGWIDSAGYGRIVLVCSQARNPLLHHADRFMQEALILTTMMKMATPIVA